jgi:hypothetical protein
MAKQYTNSQLITEMFNRYHMNMYHVLGEDGSIRNYHEFVNNGFYKEYYLDENNYLTRRTIYEPRVRDVDAEEKYCVDLLNNVNKDQILVMHNHVDPINTEIRDYLINNAHKNVWIYRRNKREQLASYAVALSTKKFAAFNKAAVSHEPVADIDRRPLDNLMRRIKVWDSLPTTDSIAFEDIPFYDDDGFPVDQNIDPWIRLSDNMKSIINEIVAQYENNSN